MRVLIPVLATLFLSLSPLTNPQPDDVADVIRVTQEHFATMRAGDFEAHVAHHLPEATSFGAGLLSTATLEEQLAGYQSDAAAGLVLNLRPEHTQVQLHGNTAIVTGYVVGTVTLPDGTSEQQTSRRTAVLVKQKGVWMEAHTHSSDLTTN